MKKQKFILALLILFVFITGCGNDKKSNKNVATLDKSTVMVGKYFGEPYKLTSSFMPILTLENNNKFKLELGVSKSVQGTYRIDSNKLVLTSSSGDESYMFSISNSALIMEEEIPSYVKKGINFKISG